jgi:tetratricopeptide (TPR) repeat protein
MEHRTKRDLALINLVTEFEAKYEKGHIEYLEEKIFYQLISYYEGERELDKAIDVVELALEQFKYRSDFYILKARILLNQGRIEDCLEVITIAESIAPFENEIVILKARAISIAGDYEEGLSLLNKIKSYALRSDLPEILISESYIHEEMKDYETMYEVLKESLFLDPKNEEALERMLLCTELSRKYEESIEFLNELLDEEPYSYMAWFNLGHAYNYIGEYEKAIEALEYSFLINQEFENGYIECAELCFQEKLYQRAYKIYREANAIFGPDSDLLVSMAKCKLALKNVTHAKHLLFKAIKYDPYNDEAFYSLGLCYVLEKNWYTAINAFHKALDIEDRCEEYYFELAKAYVQVEDYTKATFNFNKATKNGPEQSSYWAEYVSFLLKLGLFQESLAILDEAEEYTFGADLLYCRAITLYQLGDKSEAKTILEEALEEDISLHTMLFTLAPELEVDKEINSMIKYYSIDELDL